MSAAVAILPWIWAVAMRETPTRRPEKRVDPEVAFYRKYTEAMLRRYVRMTMEAGKVPSLLGQEMFRGKVTNYRVDCFDDVVIFLHDVERCLEKLDLDQQDLVSRLALQEYTVGETAVLLAVPPRTVIRRYARALDRLTRIFLSVEMLTPMECCQGGSL
jgi:hypothetical protein